MSQTSIENMFGLDLCAGSHWYANASSMTLGRLRETEDRLIYTDIVKEVWLAWAGVWTNLPRCHA